MKSLMVAAAVAVMAVACGQTDVTFEKNPVDETTLSTVHELTKQTLPTPIESAHPYANDVVQTWTVKTPACATFFRIHFASIDVEEGYDFVRLVDKDGKKVKSYTGFFSGWSPQLPGTEATIELVTDRANPGHGFVVDAIEYTADEGVGTWAKTELTGTTLVSTPHPYANGFTQNYTVKGPAGATKMRVHFKGFETEARYDIVSIFSGDMQQIATYTGPLGDFVSAEVPGDTVVVRLSSDYSIDGHGFDLVAYEALMPGGPGTCGAPQGCLQISAVNHDYGNVAVGCDATKEFTATNTCAYPVRFYKPQLGSTVFEVTQSNPAAFDLAPGASQKISVKYAPTAVGTNKGTVRLETVEQNQQHVKWTIALTGVGDTRGQNRDEFVQQGNNKADILLVVDNSCSMGPHQQSLATNFASFIGYAKDSGVDFHLGVTTTDMDTRHPTADGGVFGGPGPDTGLITDPGAPERFFSNTTPDLENKFKQRVNVGINGSSVERCFEASQFALSLSVAHKQGFLRDDASLAVVCISDETEQSTAPVDEYLNELLNLKDNDANLFTYSVIASFDSSCQSTKDDGRYLDMVTKSHGVKESICTPNWAQALQTIGRTTAGFRTEFVLTAVPGNAAAVTVQVDGKTVPAQPSAGVFAWTLDLATKTLRFAPAFAPKAGQKVTVDYAVTCN